MAEKDLAPEIGKNADPDPNPHPTLNAKGLYKRKGLRTPFGYSDIPSLARERGFISKAPLIKNGRLYCKICIQIIMIILFLKN